MKKLLSIAVLSLLMLTSIAYALSEAKSQPITLVSETAAKSSVSTVKAVRLISTGGARYSNKCPEIDQSWCQRLGRCLKHYEQCDVLPSRLGISKPGLVRVKQVQGLSHLEKPLPATDYSLQPRRERLDRPLFKQTTGGKRIWSNLAAYISSNPATN